MIVDATKRGKRFPDSFSKTVPVWACVVNRAVADVRRRRDGNTNVSWDTRLHLPRHVPENERSLIERKLDTWVQNLISWMPDAVDGLATTLAKPLRPLWVCQTTYIFTNAVAPTDALDFAPVVLVSASRPVPLSTSAAGDSAIIPARRAAGYVYVPGAGDDDESWCPNGFEASDLVRFLWALGNGYLKEEYDDDSEDSEDSVAATPSARVTAAGLTQCIDAAAAAVPDRADFVKRMHTFIARKRAASSTATPRALAIREPPDAALLLGVPLQENDASAAVAGAIAVAGCSTVVLLVDSDARQKACAASVHDAVTSVCVHVAYAPWHKARGRLPLRSAFERVHSWYAEHRARGVDGLFAVACDRPRLEHAFAALVSLRLAYGTPAVHKSHMPVALASVASALSSRGDASSALAASRPPAAAVLKSAYEAAASACVPPGAPA